MDKLNDSILVTIKKMLGLEDQYTPFDTDVIIHINAALMTLTQLGVGPKEGFQISDYNETWSSFLTNEVQLGAVRTYVYLKVKMAFDPPTNSFVMDAMKQQAEEIGWRLNVMAESVEEFDFMKDQSLIGRNGIAGFSSGSDGSSGNGDSDAGNGASYGSSGQGGA